MVRRALLALSSLSCCHFAPLSLSLSPSSTMMIRLSVIAMPGRVHLWDLNLTFKSKSAFWKVRSRNISGLISTPGQRVSSQRRPAPLLTAQVLLFDLLDEGVFPLLLFSLTDISIIRNCYWLLQWLELTLLPIFYSPILPSLSFFPRILRTVSI